MTEQEVRDPDLPTYQTSNKCEIKSCYCELSMGAGHNDEPPIGVGRGSCFMDIPAAYDLNSPTFQNNYHVYTFKRPRKPPYEFISDIAIMTEIGGANGGGVSFHHYTFTKECNAKLRLWLGYYPTDTPKSDPDIIFDGDSGGYIKTKRNMNTIVPNNKFVRDKRCGYPDPMVIVIKWDIVDKNGTHLTHNGVPLINSNDDMYYFYVNFEHPATP